MAHTTQPPADLGQRIATMQRNLSTVQRHLIGLTKAIDEIEREMLALYAPQSDGERAARRAREEIFLTGPQNVKEAIDPDVVRMFAMKK